jgi:hypothetical protein
LKHLNILEFSIRASAEAALVVLNRSCAGRSSDRRTGTGRHGPELMATKDFIYLALIALAGVIFYLRGYHAGFTRGKKMFGRFFNNAEALAALPPPEPPPVPMADLVVLRGTRSFFKTSNIRAVFGNN